MFSSSWCDDSGSNEMNRRHFPPNTQHPWSSVTTSSTSTFFFLSTSLEGQKFGTPFGDVRQTSGDFFYRVPGTFSTCPLEQCRADQSRFRTPNVKCHFSHIHRILFFLPSALPMPISAIKWIHQHHNYTSVQYMHKDTGPPI